MTSPRLARAARWRCSASYKNLKMFFFGVIGILTAPLWLSIFVVLAFGNFVMEAFDVD